MLPSWVDLANMASEKKHKKMNHEKGHHTI
jgi:hypothetical protein